MTKFKTSFNDYLFDKELLNISDELTFYDFPFSMQWGVYVDFFDSVGYKIFLRLNPLNGGIKYEIWKRIERAWKSKNITGVVSAENNIDEARRAALKKAIEIYNK